MKKNLKNTSAKVLAVALAAGMVVSSLPGTVASAKKKVKNPTLGKTKVSITVGKTKKNHSETKQRSESKESDD